MDATPNPQANSSPALDTPMNDSPPKYVPQFSAATEMILKRINSGAGSTSLSSIGINGTPPGYEDMRRSVLQGMKTTLNMEIPSTPVDTALNKSRAVRNSGSSAGRGEPRGSGIPTNNGSGGRLKAAARARNGKAGAKRKRVKEDSDSVEDSGDMSGLGGDSDSDGTASITELPKVTQSGRQVFKPVQFIPAVSEGPARKRGPTKRAQEQALCKRCGRGHSPQSNMIVFCDGCNLGWHQMCHDPIVSDEAVKDEAAAWFCADCTRKRSTKITALEQTKGASWQAGSTEDKRAYLSSLPQQQLVALLLQATALHPDLPIFPPTSTQSTEAHVVARSQQHERRTNVYPQQPFPPPATAGLFSRAEANPNAPINFIRKIFPGQTTTQNTPPSTSSVSFPSPTLQPVQIHSASAPPTLPPQSGHQGVESRESTPPSPPYPKPGIGLMAKLGPDEEDLEWLVDGNDFEAFSHVVYDENGEKSEENGVQVPGEGATASA